MSEWRISLAVYPSVPVHSLAKCQAVEITTCIRSFSKSTTNDLVHQCAAHSLAALAVTSVTRRKAVAILHPRSRPRWSPTKSCLDLDCSASHSCGSRPRFFARDQQINLNWFSQSPREGLGSSPTIWAEASNICQSFEDDNTSIPSSRLRLPINLPRSWPRCTRAASNSK